MWARGLQQASVPCPALAALASDSSCSSPAIVPLVVPAYPADMRLVPAGPTLGPIDECPPCAIEERRLEQGRRLEWGSACACSGAPPFAACPSNRCTAR